MALRYTADFRSFDGRSYVIEIHDNAWSGAVTEFLTGGDGFVLRWEPKERTRMNAILGSEVTFQIDMSSPDLESFITDLATASESRFTVKIKNPVFLYWAGTLTAEVTKYPDDSPYFFEVRATDGLGALADVDYVDGSGNLYTGFSSITQVISRVLKSINHVNVHYAGTDKLFETSCDWWEARHTTGPDKDPLAQTYVNNEVFKIIKSKNEQTPMKCLEVLESVLVPFGMRIVQNYGTFKVEQMSYRSAAGYYLRRYSRDGAYLNYVQLSTENVINQTTSGALLATGIYEYLPPLKKVTVTFETKSRRNLIDGIVLNTDNDSGTFYTPIESNGGETTIRWSGSINMNLKNVSYSGSQWDAVIFVWKIRIVIGDKVMVRTHTINNFQIQYGPASWETNTVTNWADELTPVNGIPSIGNSAAYTFSTDITTPKLPIDGESYAIKWELVSAKKYDGTSVFIGDFDITYSVQNAWLEVYSYGAPELSEDEEHYITNNPTSGNSVVEEYPTRFGDGTNPNAYGALRILDTTYKRTVFWKEGTGTADQKIGQLLSKSILAGQATLIRKFNATFFGDLDLNKKYDWGGAEWFMLAASWNAQRDEINGEFVEFNYTPGVTASPIKIIIKVPIGGGIATPPSTNTGGGLPGGLAQNAQLVAMPPATIMNSVSSNALASQLNSGAITSLSLVETLGAGEYIVGDEITVINPITSQNETLTVTADSTAGATTLAVSGTLSGNYPPSAYVIKKSQTGYKINDVAREVVTGVGSSVTVTVASTSLLPRKADHVKLIVGRLIYSATEGDFSFSKSGLTFTLSGINADCNGLNGFVEWMY